MVKETLAVATVLFACGTMALPMLKSAATEAPATAPSPALPAMDQMNNPAAQFFRQQAQMFPMSFGNFGQPTQPGAENADESEDGNGEDEEEGDQYGDFIPQPQQQILAQFGPSFSQPQSPLYD